MNKIVITLLIFVVFSCQKTQSDLIVKGSIKDLKKGTLYLKKANDSTLFIVDSLVITGPTIFELDCTLENPEVCYLCLDKNSSKNECIAFFADKGITEINTTLKGFAVDAKISGSKHQQVLDEYDAMIRRFTDKDLDLYKENFEAIKGKDSTLINKVQDERNSLLKRKFLYTVNFAINHKNSEVAPYLALTEIYNANIKLLDTINNSLTPNIKASKYGIELQNFIDKIKSEKN